MAMGPIVEECTKDYADKSIEFVTFDFTTKETTQAAAARAKALGVEGLFNENAGNTGFLLLYDTSANKVVTRLSADDSTEGWHAAIDNALGGA